MLFLCHDPVMLPFTFSAYKYNPAFVHVSQKMVIWQWMSLLDMTKVMVLRCFFLYHFSVLVVCLLCTRADLIIIYSNNTLQNPSSP